MGEYSNVSKANDSRGAGVKYIVKYVDAAKVVNCPKLPDTKTTNDDYLIATGDFVFQTPATDGFFNIEVTNRTGELKWKSVGSPGNLKSMLELDFDYAGISSAFARFISEAKNDNLIMVIERADCSGQRFLVGGCCLPAQMVGWEGTLGKSPQDDVKTNVKFEAYSSGLPVMLPDGIVLPEAA